MKKEFVFIFFMLCASPSRSQQDDNTALRQQKRELHYRPVGKDFVKVSGSRRFTRAIYGTNTACRIEAGDLPEFALYMPGMGGNLQFGLIAGNRSKWLIDANNIKTIYRPGCMLYEIRDSLLGNGVLQLVVLALADAEGVIIKTTFNNITGPVRLVSFFGGASGKKFPRDGDVGADPESSFYLKEENCRDNQYTISGDGFQLSYGAGKKLAGIFPAADSLKLVDATGMQDPKKLFLSASAWAPLIACEINRDSNSRYTVIYNPDSSREDYSELADCFHKAEQARKKIADRIIVDTPDEYINTIGGALSIAADAIWEDPSYLHGAVAWRMRLNAWRGAYAADRLGWHDRARKHFSSYALSQITAPAVTGVVMDTALHLARHLEKTGTALFSDGYISRNPGGDIRAHHYDMNLVFVDQLLDHFNWTGDTAYIKQMWPLIKRHLAWEKRNFDMDGDGLYDAYASIWASDALQYSGGGVTHSSAYNYRANKTAAALAVLIGEDPSYYEKEAAHIEGAVQAKLWIPATGAYAEYKDLLGKQLVHPAAGLWTIYQAIDSKLPNPFQAYQGLRYIDGSIPHIPVQAKGLHEKGLFLLSTTNWQPYTWSINNVALAENLQTALAYWQGNRHEVAYRLWRTAIIEAMYLSASPGGFEQLSYYDAVRGELYRDFADPIGVAARSLVEGLFGVLPDVLHRRLVIQPGFPGSWDHAGLHTPDIDFVFTRKADTDTYLITERFNNRSNLLLLLPVWKQAVARVTVNGLPVKWDTDAHAVGQPKLQVEMEAAEQYKIIIEWQGALLSTGERVINIMPGEQFQLNEPLLKLDTIYDPQNVLRDAVVKRNRFSAGVWDKPGNHSFFVKAGQGAFAWWMPVNLAITPLKSTAPAKEDEDMADKENRQWEKLDLRPYFNDRVTNVFKHQYLSPRPVSPTLQLPTQGMGNWCYPLITATINDSGTRKSAFGKNVILSSGKVPFAFPGDSMSKNILFTSQWDNFPDSISIALTGRARHIYFLLAGTTNPMQSRITNGMLVVTYTDNSADTLLLKNPENWWPIEQDYLTDGLAFTTGAQRPERLYLKQGKFSKQAPAYSVIKGFTEKAIDGGAGIVLDMQVNKTKELRALTIYAIANDVVVGLMAATVIR